MEIKNEPNQSKKFNIPAKIKSYKIERELCIISNAHICLGTNLNIKEKVLIKIYDKETIQNNSEEIYLINNEISIISLINHKNVLKLYEIIESPSYIFLIMEYFNTTKLIDYIKSKKKFTEDECINIYKQIISILLYFREMNIGHLNLNPNDIFIDNSNNIKLCDFKYGVFYSTQDKVKCQYIGDANFLCPELLSDKSCFPDYADIWSSGVILYLLIVGQLPFKGINNYDLQKKIMGAEFALPLNISKNMQELIKNIFEVKIEQRYNLDKILSSNLFKEKKINKNNLAKGFNILSTKYPYDERVLNICKTYYNIDTDELKQKLNKNIFDPQTSLYKQIINKFVRKKISSEIDLYSKKFINYIDNKKNFFDNNLKNSNIKDNLDKYQEIKDGNPKIIENIKNKQTNTLIKLEELIQKYKNIIEKEKEKEKEEEEEKEEKEEEKEKEEKEEENNKEEENRENKDIKENNLEENKENKENIPENKINVPENKYKHRRSVNYYPKKFHKFNTYENQLNLGRRRSSAVDTKEQIKETLEKLHSINIDINQIEHRSKKSNKYLPKSKDIIKEVKLEEKKDDTPKKSSKISRKSSLSKSSSKPIENNTNKVEETLSIINNVLNNKEKNDLKDNDVQSKSVKPQKERKNVNLNDNTTTKKAKPQPQVTKEEFFNQIKNVKLKKYTPNTYANPDEIKKKQKEENKNSTSVEYRNISVRNVLQMVEENLKNSKKNKNIAQNKYLPVNYKKKNPNRNKINKQGKINKIFNKRKSIKSRDLYMFKSKGLMINKNEIKKEKSKDDTSRFKFKAKNPDDAIAEEDINEFVMPKDYKTERRIKEEKRKKYEEKRRKDEEEKRRKREKEEKNKRDMEEKRRRDAEEKILKKERELKSKRDQEQKRKREIEERKRKEQEEMKLRLLEEERKRKELEEEEKLRKKREQEEERQLILEEELKRRREEERERKIKELKEREEEEKRKEEQEKIKKEKEKEKKRLEEDNKIRKWIEDAKRQKELEEKKKKEEEEKERKEEKEKERKRKEESERKRRELQEENRRRYEEYEKMLKEEEEKKLMKESLRKKKEEELRKKRDMEFKEKLQSSNKKLIVIKSHSESKSQSSDDDEDLNSIKNNNVKKNLNSELNKSMQVVKKVNKYNLYENPFEKYKDQYPEEIFQPKKIPRNSIKKKKLSLHVITKRRKTGPKLIDLNKFRESERYPSDDDSSEEKKIRKKKKSIIDKNKIQKPTKRESIRSKRYYKQFTNFFFNNNTYNTIDNTKKKNNTIDIKQKEDNKNKKNNLFYHYQHNQGKPEQKSIYERSLQIKKRNLRNASVEKRLNNSYNNNIKEQNKKKINIPSNNIKPIKMRTGNTYINNNDIKTDYNTNKILPNNKLEKSSTKKRILKTKTEAVKIKTLPKPKLNSENTMKNTSINFDKYLNKNKTNYILDQETIDYYSNSLLSNSTILTKNRNINNFSNISEFDANNSNKTMIKIKQNQHKSKTNIKDIDLNLYKGNVNYNNVSAKNFEQSLNELMSKYKNKGYTCVKKNKTKFKFVKGPNIHNVEIMRLGNGLLYFNVLKN